jgi:hypothetical protein
MSTRGASLDTLTKLVSVGGALPVRVGAAAACGGGRGLFAARALRAGERVGPIAPAAAATKVAPPPPVFRNNPALAGKGKKGAAGKGALLRPSGAPQAAVQAAVQAAEQRGCTLCCLAAGRPAQCALCGEGASAAVKEFAAALERALAVSEKLRRARPVAAPAADGDTSAAGSRFALLAERLVLRMLVEEAVMGAANTLELVRSLAAPVVGPETIAREWAPIWSDGSGAGVARSVDDAMREAGFATERVRALQTYPLARDVFLQAMAAMHINSVGGPATSALYASLAMANHACKPSCGVAFDGAVAYLVPTRDLREGDELTIHYAENVATIKSQPHLEAYLEFNYGFRCQAACGCGANGATSP